MACFLGDRRGAFRGSRLSAGSKTAFAHLALRASGCTLDASGGLRRHSSFHNCNTQIYLSLQHEDDIVTAKRSLFLTPGDEIFLDGLGVGEGIVKIKGRVGPCHVRFPLVPVIRGVVGDDLLNSRGDDHRKEGVG